LHRQLQAQVFFTLAAVVVVLMVALVWLAAMGAVGKADLMLEQALMELLIKVVAVAVAVALVVLVVLVLLFCLCLQLAIQIHIPEQTL
jgi:hypothetical protein